MYRHYVIGMFKGLDGRSYEILAPAPDYHFDKKSVQNDKVYEYRFNVIETFGILDMKLDDISLKANCLNFE